MAVKKEKNNERKWIEGAYSHFADVGPEQLNVKRISEITGLPRTNFYYHFPDTDILVTQLLNFHMDVSKEYEKELRQKLKVLFRTSIGSSLPLKPGSSSTGNFSSTEAMCASATFTIL
jgi:AcrR family transcriptional regulator